MTDGYGHREDGTHVLASSPENVDPPGRRMMRLDDTHWTLRVQQGDTEVRVTALPPQEEGDDPYVDIDLVETSTRTGFGAVFELDELLALLEGLKEARARAWAG